MQDNNLNKRRLIAAVSILVIILGVIIAVVLLRQPAKKTETTSSQPNCDYVQANSTNDEGCTLKPVYSADTIAVVGYSDLVDAGMSTDSLTSMKKDVYLYGQQIGQQIKSFDVEDSNKIIHKTPGMNPDGSSSWEFPVRINDKDTFSAKVSSQSLSDARLLLYNGSALVFDSQAVTPTEPQ
jgi:hypothetical protein